MPRDVRRKAEMPKVLVLLQEEINLDYFFGGNFFQRTV
jgi:hypothetical protein